MSSARHCSCAGSYRGMTDDDIKAIEAKWAPAKSTLPWEVREHEGLRAVACRDGWVCSMDGDPWYDRHNAAAIAAAPSDIARLIAEVQRLRTENEQLLDELDARLDELDARSF